MKNSSRKEIIFNIGWLFFDKILRLGGGLLVSIVVARYLAPDLFGKMSYVIAFAGIFGAMSTLGLDSLMVRELVRREQDKYSLMGTAFALKMAAALGCFLLSIFSISLFTADTRIRVMVAVVAAGLLFQSFDIMRLWFESNVRSKYVVIAQNTSFVIFALAKLWMAASGAPLEHFIWAVTLEVALAMVILGIFYSISGESLAGWKFERRLATRLLRECWPLLISSLAVMVYMRIPIVLLRSFQGDIEVGLYSAASSLSEAWYFVPTIVITSVYPRLVSLYKEDESAYTRELKKLMKVFFWFSLAVALPVALFSRVIITAIFGSRYLAAHSILSILMFAGIIVNMSVIFSHRFVLQNKQNFLLYGTFAGGIASLVLNFALIPRFSMVGAAAATIISYLVPIVFISVFFDRNTGEIFAGSIAGAKGE